jgi:ankyrin repeat protein
MAERAAKPELAAPSSATSSSEIVVTAEKREEPADQLRAAAAAGRTDEIRALLARGVPVDAPDSDGNTALMKSIEADQPAAATLLRRHGASVRHKNHAGQSAQDLAKAAGDAELDKAVGVKP